MYRLVLLEIGRYRWYFFRYETRGVICTGLLAGMVYTGRTGRYGTKSTPLFSRAEIKWTIEHQGLRFR